MPGDTARGALKLQADILCGKVDIAHGHLDVCMAHEPHQDGKGHAFAYHVDGEGVAQAMRIGLVDPAPLPVITKEFPQSDSCHGIPTMGSLESHEEKIVASEGPLELEVGRESSAHVRGDGQHTVPLTLTGNADLLLEQVHFL